MGKRPRAYSFNQNFSLYSETFKRDYPRIFQSLETGKEMRTELTKNEDGTYTLTLGQIEDLVNGKMKLINGRLYLDGRQVKLSDLTMSDKEWHQGSCHPKDRLKDTPIPEIKGVELKNSELDPLVKSSVNQLVKSISINGGKHPFTWVQEAGMLAAFAGWESIRPLLDVLNTVIPLKEGMELGGFTAKEFDQKYLYSRPSLLEQWTTADEPTVNMIRASDGKNLGPLTPTAEDLIPRPIDMNNLVVDHPVFLSPGIDGMEDSRIREFEHALREFYCNYVNDTVGNFHDFTILAGILYGKYKGCVHLLDQNDLNPEYTKWVAAIDLQEQYWRSFRGRTISILKLFNKFLNPGDKLYHLETPTLGMKKP
jgi:hypothetical protein